MNNELRDMITKDKTAMDYLFNKRIPDPMSGEWREVTTMQEDGVRRSFVDKFSRRRCVVTPRRNHGDYSDIVLDGYCIIQRRPNDNGYIDIVMDLSTQEDGISTTTFHDNE